VATQDDIARLLDEMIRLQALEVRRRADSQVEAILELRKAGIGPTRIADLLGTTANTVNVAIANAKKSTKSKTKREVQA
jgi:DNA-binding CsgD family transcriptional regulator